MRLFALFLLLFSLAQSVAAQLLKKPPLVVGSSTMFGQKAAVAAHAGRPYRLTMRAQADTTDGAWASLGIVYLRGRSYLGHADVYDQKTPLNRVRSRQWLTYTITGTLPQKADTVLLTPNVNGNGRFAFDDFRLEAQAPGGTWQPVPLANGNLEAAAPADSSATRLPPGWRASDPTAGYTYRVAAEASGNHYLLLRGSGTVPYGSNARAGRYVVANGTKIYCETYGQGQPLLLLHGNGGSISEMRYQIADLARQYQVIVVDTRDQGKSAATKPVLTYDLFADDMAALLAALRLPAAHVVGWSDGGNTGLSLALRHPARVRSLTTMGANIFIDSTVLENKVLQQFTEASRKSPKQYRRLFQLMLDYPRQQPAQLAAIKAPVLVLAGEKDIIKEAHTRLIAASIPGAELRIFPGLSHYAPQEDPAVFNRAVLEFLAKH